MRVSRESVYQMVLKTSLWQVGYMDEVVGNVTTQLKGKGMWENVNAQIIHIFSTLAGLRLLISFA